MTYDEFLTTGPTDSVQRYEYLRDNYGNVSDPSIQNHYQQNVTNLLTNDTYDQFKNYDFGTPDGTYGKYNNQLLQDAKITNVVNPTANTTKNIGGVWQGQPVSVSANMSKAKVFGLKAKNMLGNAWGNIKNAVANTPHEPAFSKDEYKTAARVGAKLDLLNKNRTQHTHTPYKNFSLKTKKINEGSLIGGMKGNYGGSGGYKV